MGCTKARDVDLSYPRRVTPRFRYLRTIGSIVTGQFVHTVVILVAF
jgi:hypothetical protein